MFISQLSTNLLSSSTNPLSTRTIVAKPRRVWTPTGINVYKKVYEKNDQDLKTHIEKLSLDLYGQPSKPLQTDAVLNLVKGRNTFLLAGTGFGKSRIAELYFKLIPQNKHAVVLVLNPLDSLGDNQVYEKEQAGFTAINLTKLSFNETVAKDISNGAYQFVYMSPETFLNNKIWDSIYFSSDFQNRLALIVVDEAHMIYLWGLVASGQGKKAAAILLRFQDVGIFRPCYGNLGGHLLFRNDKPILLLSATCRPIAIAAIKTSLKLDDGSVDILQGELTRPEIRIIRITMEKSLSSSLDLIRIFPSAKDIQNHELVPTLVYSGSRNRTLTVMDVIDRARETPRASLDPHNTCVRRYHSCTGDLDKARCVDQFASRAFPVISATMALGLGQNWKRVRMVAHMGRGDPAQIAQMIGRCGRDGRKGLAVLFMEKNRRAGKNTIEQFTRGAEQTDEDRIDAMAITPVCLRIAFSLDNLLGYVPLWMDDPSYIREMARETLEGFEPCRCSNCAGPEAANLIKNLVLANQGNFDDILDDTFHPPSVPEIGHKYPMKRPAIRKRKIIDDEMGRLNMFKLDMIHAMEELYASLTPSGGALELSDLFDNEEAESICSNLHNISTKADISLLIGGQCFSGQLESLVELVLQFKIRHGDENSTVHLQKVCRTNNNTDLNHTDICNQGSSISLGSVLGTDNRQVGASGLVPYKTKRALAAEKRKEKAQKKVLSDERDRKRRVQVAAIMAQAWENAKTAR